MNTCRALVTKVDRMRRKPNTTTTGCTKPPTATGLCAYHEKVYARRAERAKAVGRAAKYRASKGAGQ